MRKSQRGVTMIGWLILLAPIAVLVYAGIRLTPFYLNYFRVTKALQQVAAESRGGGVVSPDAVRASLGKRFDVEYVDHPTPKDIDVRRDGDHWIAVADYEELAPLFGNVSILVQFKKQVELQ